MVQNHQNADLRLSLPFGKVTPSQNPWKQRLLAIAEAVDLRIFRVEFKDK
jgi:hypothetical protein